MKIDRYARVVLTVIAVALALMAVRAFLAPTSSHAARPIEYKVLEMTAQLEQRLEATLNAMGKQGWDISAAHPGFLVMKR